MTPPSYLHVKNTGVMLREGGREAGREREVFKDEIPTKQAVFVDCLDAVKGGDKGTERFPNRCCGVVLGFGILPVPALPPSLVLALLLEQALVEC
jgi:hypothetical protein